MEEAMGGICWCRVEVDGRPRLGRVEGDRVMLYEGSLFDNPSPSGTEVGVSDASWLPPVEPRQFLGLWNNFHERQQAEGTLIPDFPLFFVKLAGSLSAHRQAIRRPPGFAGRVKFEAELGIVIGTECFQPERDRIDDFVFGYTCVNDITAPEPLFANPEFPQWCRAKSFPGFGPIGPVIATGLDPAALRVRGVLDGEIKQDYPVSDMIFSPQEIVWHIAHEIALYPGDVIACGTSVGAADMADGQTIVIEIPGIGSLSNRLF
jgi:2-keto-4-pentenoate hydratase/2-oxohepta-3-ene-1,7-dioic acid hydratase in catechol pathway